MNNAEQRWDAFLSKIKDKAHEYMNALRTEALQMVKQSQGDPVPISTAIHAVNLQIQQLIRKMNDTWDEQVEQALEAERYSSSKIDQQRLKGTMVQISLVIELWEMELEVNYRVAEYIFALAQQHKPHAICSQCSATLAIPEHTYSMERITCTFCQTINTYEPGTYQRLVGSYCAEHFAQWNAKDLLLATVEVEEKLQLLRDEAFEKGKLAWRESHKRYSEKYLIALKRFKPNLDVTKELDLIMSKI